MRYSSIRDSVLRCTVGPLVVLLFAVLVVYVVLVVLLVDLIDSFRYGPMGCMHKELVHPGTLTQCRGKYMLWYIATSPCSVQRRRRRPRGLRHPMSTGHPCPRSRPCGRPQTVGGSGN